MMGIINTVLYASVYLVTLGIFGLQNYSDICPEDEFNAWYQFYQSYTINTYCKMHNVFVWQMCILELWTRPGNVPFGNNFHNTQSDAQSREVIQLIIVDLLPFDTTEVQTLVYRVFFVLCLARKFHICHLQNFLSPGSTSTFLH
jgi:hypothetical protein